MKTITKNLTRLIATGLIAMLAVAGPASANHNHEQSGKSYGTKKYNNYQSRDGCVHYQVSAYGGDGGIRFLHNTDEWNLVQGSGQHGKVCRDGYVTVELSKRHPATTVTLAINGQNYTFNSGERAHKYIDNWHRKYIDIRLSHSQVRGNTSTYDYGYNHGGNKQTSQAYGHITDRYGHTPYCQNLAPHQHYRNHDYGYNYKYRDNRNHRQHRYQSKHGYNKYYPYW